MRETDVIVIRLGFMEQFLDAIPIPELGLLFNFKTSVNQKYFPINSAYLSLGKETFFDFDHFITVLLVQTINILIL